MTHFAHKIWKHEYSSTTTFCRELPSNVVEVTQPLSKELCVELSYRKAIPMKEQLLHLVLEVKENGSPTLTIYQRVIIK